jgi:hypothetical protein
LESIYQKDAKLEVHMLDPHGGTIVLTPKVLVSEKYRELRWLRKLEGEVEFNGEHISLLSLWGKQGSLYPQLKVHRFNGCTP